MDIINKTFQILPKEFRFKFFLIFLSSIVVIILELLSISLILPFTTLLIDPNKLNFLNKYFDYTNLFGSINSDKILFYGVLFFIFVFFLKVLSLFLLNIYKTNFFYNLKIKMVNLLYKKYLNEEYLFHVNINSSILITNIHGEIALYNKKILNTFCELFLDIILLCCLLAILINIRPLETTIALALFIFFSGIYFLFIKKRLDYWGKERQKQDRLKLKHVQQSLTGIKEVKIYLKELFFENALNKIVTRREDVSRKLSYISPLPRYFLEIGTVIFVLALVYFITWKGENIENLLPEFALYFGSFLRMLPIFTKLINNFQTLKFGKPVVNTLHKEYHSEQKVVVDKSFNNPPLHFNEKISFKKVFFKYPSKKDYSLKDLNLNFKQGEIIGILGTTGSGKTTFLNLLTGLIKPTDGEILCDNTNIMSNNISWRKKLSYVTQKTFLTDDSIRNNIIFGENENFKNQKFEEALKLSNLDKLIDKLPDGVNTIVGESGVRLSGGQVQRISIARALYNSPEILVFDEPTNSLDEETEKKIISEIFELKGKCTIFLVTHNRQLTTKCDQTYLVEKNTLIKI